MRPKKRNERTNLKDDETLEDWGNYMTTKKKKLEKQFEQNKPFEKSNETNDGKSNLFSGISIFVNGYTDPCATELKRLMMIHGGIYYHYYNQSKCKYIIATNLAESKIKALRNEKVIHPKWIVECINAGKLLPVEPYLLYKNSFKQQRSISCFTKQPDSKKFTGENDKNVRNPNNEERTQSLTAADNNFLSEFYSHSRLHHISNSGAEFKQYIADLQKKEVKVFPGLEKLKSLRKSNDVTLFEGNRSCIMHLDMDCFFVSVGLRSHPELVNKPVAVAHSNGKAPVYRKGMDLNYERKYFNKVVHGNESESDNDCKLLKNGYEYPSMSEIACCSYEARSFGLKNGMFLGPALKLCPNLQIIPYEFENYKGVSFSIYDIVVSYTHCVEAVSCDEMFVDCTNILKEYGISPIDFANFIRDEIKMKTGCNSSAGLGSNILMARLATHKAKPNGSHFVTTKDQSNFIIDVNVRNLPGVGRSMEKKLAELNVNTCGDLQTIPLNVLRKEFGQKTGDNLFKFSRGICNRALKTSQERKSVSAEVNYGIRFQSEKEALRFFSELSLEVSNRMKKLNVKGKIITLKLKVRAADAPVETSKFLGHGICNNVTKSISLMYYTDCPDVIYKKCTALLRTINVLPQDLRGIGIQVQKLNDKNDSYSSVNGNVYNMFKLLSHKVNKSGTSTMDAGVSGEASATDKDKLIDNRQVKSSGPKELYTTAQETYRMSDYMPSQLSKIDASVLKQLPEDLHDQIIKNCHGSPHQLSNQSENVQSNSGSVSLEEIDKNVFLALPQEIKDEVIATYPRLFGKSSKSENALIKTEKVPTIFSKKRSKHVASPPKHKGGKGKTAKLSPTKNFGCHGNKKITDHLISKELQADIKLPEVKKKLETSVRKLQEIEFCGSCDFKEIKVIIKSWIEASCEPEKHDLELFTKYLMDVSRNNDLELLDLLLKHLHRQLKTKGSVWHRVYFEIADVIQREIVKLYGSKLFMNMVF